MTDEAKDIEEMLRFDPFEGQSEDDSGQKADSTDDESVSADGGGDAGSQQTEDDQQTQSEDSASADDDTAESGKSDESREQASGESEELAALKEQNRQLSLAVQGLQDQIQNMGKSAEDDSQSPSDDSVPEYSFTIPNEIVEGIADEDPAKRQAAVAGLVSGIGQTVHKTLREEMKQREDALRKELSQQSQDTSQRTSQVERIQQDYFGTFKEHDKEIVRPIVQTKAQEVMREWGVREWSIAVRDEIGRRVNQTLQASGVTFGGKQDDPPNPPKPNGGQAPHQRRSGASPAAQPGGANSPDDISQTLFG